MLSTMFFWLKARFAGIKIAMITIEPISLTIFMTIHRNKYRKKTISVSDRLTYFSQNYVRILCRFKPFWLRIWYIFYAQAQFNLRLFLKIALLKHISCQDTNRPRTIELRRIQHIIVKYYINAVLQRITPICLNAVWRYNRGLKVTKKN